MKNPGHFGLGVTRTPDSISCARGIKHRVGVNEIAGISFFFGGCIKLLCSWGVNGDANLLARELWLFSRDLLHITLRGGGGYFMAPPTRLIEHLNEGATNTVYIGACGSFLTLQTENFWKVAQRSIITFLPCFIQVLCHVFCIKNVNRSFFN